MNLKPMIYGNLLALAVLVAFLLLFGCNRCPPKAAHKIQITDEATGGVATVHVYGALETIAVDPQTQIHVEVVPE
jgi:hypothetical protein